MKSSMINFGQKAAYLAVLQAMPFFACAQEAEIPTVVVAAGPLAGGVNAPLSQVPSNAQIIEAKEIEDQGVTNLADLLNNSLGSVSLSGGTGNPYQNDVSYRGMQATSLLGAPVGLSVYFDGVRVNEPFGAVVNWDLIPVNAIATVDVLPGSNPLFGMNTIGGALVVNTKNGRDDPGTDLTLQGGSFARRAISFEHGGVGEGNGNDYIIAANADRQDGYRDHSSSDVKQLFGKMRWAGNGGRTTAELSAAIANTDLRGTQALPFSMLPNPKSAYTWPDSIGNDMALLNLKFAHLTAGGDKLSGAAYYRRSNSHSVNSNAGLDDGCFDANGNTVAACLNITQGKGTAPNAVAANPYGLARYTGDINTSIINSSTHQNTFGTTLQWTNRSSLSVGENSIAVGGIAESSHVSYNQTTLLARLIDYQAVVTPNLRYYFPAVGGVSGSNALNGVSVSGKTDNYSLYLTDTLSIAEKLNLTLSGSYNIAKLTQSGATNRYLNDDGGYSWTDAVSGIKYYNPSYVGSQYYSGATLKTISNATVASMTAGPEISSLAGDHTFRRFNPAVGFTFNPDKRLGFFGGYSESMRAPTAVELSCANPAQPCALPTGFNGDPDLKAVVAHTVEIGARGRSGALSWNMAAYDTKLDNDIQFIYSGTSGLGYFANVGTTERKGLEVGATQRLGNISISANYGYVNATYRSAFLNANGDQVNVGDRIPGIPSQTLKIRGAYQASSSLLVGANLSFVSGQYAHGDEPNQDANGKLPGYALANLDVHYKVSDSVNVFALVNNAFDKKYATYGVLGTNVYTGNQEQFRTPASGRSIWLGLTYSIGGKSASGS